MKFKIHQEVFGLGIAIAALSFSTSAFAFNEEAAKALARENKCLQCHAIAKKDTGPAYKEVAAKYRGKADAVERLMNHLTSGEMAKFPPSAKHPDGHEEPHKIIKADSKDEIRNLVLWILSL